MKTLFAAILLSAVPAMAAEIYDFSILPSSGDIQGAPGSTIGWGYSIDNESSSLWLVTTAVDAGVFQNGTPDLLFDFPAIAPGSSVTVPFNEASSMGLEELTWDSSAPDGFTNSGTFVLTAQWWNGDPLAGGQFQFAAPNQGQSYSATAGSATAAPEPATFALIGLPLLAFSLLLRRAAALQRKSARDQAHAESHASGLGSVCDPSPPHELQRINAMKSCISVRRVVVAAFLTSSFVVSARTGAAQTVPTMTIKIYNNSASYSIYPVLSTGAHSVDTWMQAAFKIPKSQLDDNPYPTPSTFRLYFNPAGGGIPPHGSITVTLPLFTQLVPGDQANPKLPDQYIDWWNGGRISIYASLYSDGAPPKALVANYTRRTTQKLLAPVAGATVPACSACQQPLEIFGDSGGELPSNDPAQLTEYTLGAIDLTKDPYTLDVTNVDYDVSYVDNVYLPAAMEPYNNPVVGWIGTIQEIQPFKDALRKFLTAPSFTGWPQFVDNEGETILKVPSALHIMQDQANLTPAPPWAPIEQMKTLWRDCSAGGTQPICSDIRDVRDLFEANYSNYSNNYRTAFSGACDQTKGPDPATLDEDAMLAHVYAWTPFNANCTAQTNLLQDTPGYQENNYSGYQSVKSEFDALNNWPTGEFNPYVKLVHDPQYLNAEYVYAYSVDDAVGNMQTTGEGLIIAVGGTAGLPNPKPATAPIHVPFGWAATDAVRFVKYGICADTPDQNVNPNFTSFDLSANQLSSCTLSFIDNQSPPSLYFFKITTQPPYPSRPPDNEPIPAANKTMIDCGGNTQFITDTWCKNIFGYTQAVAGSHKREDDYISVPAPAQPPQAPTTHEDID